MRRFEIPSRGPATLNPRDAVASQLAGDVEMQPREEEPQFEALDYQPDDEGGPAFRGASGDLEIERCPYVPSNPEKIINEQRVPLCIRKCGDAADGLDIDS